MNSSVHVCLTASLELWLLNKTDADVQLNPGELFGFGPVKAAEAAVGFSFSSSNFDQRFEICKCH